MHNIKAFDASLEALINLLQDGGIHSGESLGNKLGVSRAAIWKHLSKLDQFGIGLETIKGQGYRIPNGLDLLDLKRIQRTLPDNIKSSINEIIFSPIVSSTNQMLLDRIRQHQNIHQVICLTEMQSQGRGRRGRSWESPFASNIYLSMAWKFERGIAAVEGLSLVVGLAVYRALLQLNFKVGLKWPNDLLYEGKKLGGILVEISGDVSGDCFVVIGLGVNVRMPPTSAENIDQPWIDLKTIAKAERFEKIVNRSDLVATILIQLIPMLEKFGDSGFAPFKNEWESAHVYQGQRVNLNTGSQYISGTVLGVNENGALRLDVAGSEQVVVGGEVTLRGV